MISYAGIGSRQITECETETIINIAKKLSEKYVLYSGNAEGSDITFQIGSNKNCVLLVPWMNFNKNKYSHDNCIDVIDCGDTPEGNASIDKFHPSPISLSRGGRRMMARNYHQIHGILDYPRVSFVICCANRDEHGKIIGGTGQACRIAESLNIPVINIRDAFYEEMLEQTLKEVA